MRRTSFLISLTLAAAALVVPEPALAAGQLLVLNKSADTLAFVDPDKLEVLATVATGHAPHEVAVDATGSTAYISNYGTQTDPGHTLSVVDVAGRRAVTVIDLGEFTRPHGIVIAQDGSLWVTCEGSQAVVVVDPKERKVVRSFSTGEQVTHMIVLAPGGGKAFTANIGSDTVTMIDASTGEVTRIPVGKGPEGIDITPDGRQVWVAHRADGGLSIIDAGTGKVTRTIEKIGEMPIRLKFTADGGRALISCANGGEVVIYDAREVKELGRIKTGEMPVGILVMPGGHRAFVANTRSDRVTLLDLDKREILGTFSPGKEPDGLAWSSR